MDIYQATIVGFWVWESKEKTYKRPIFADARGLLKAYTTFIVSFNIIHKVFVATLCN